VPDGAIPTVAVGMSCERKERKVLHMAGC
jgi:hypothetical protein